MAEFTIQTEKITGHIGEENASGVFSARVSFEDGSVGTFVSCILVKGRNEEGLSAQVKDIFDIANKKLEGAGAGSLKVLQEAGEASKSLIETHNLKSSFAQVLFYKNASYFFRSGDKVKIFVYRGDEAQEISFEHGSGHIKDKQVFVLGTDKFFSNFKIDSYLSESDVNIEEVVDGLATEVSAKDDQSEIGAALVSIREDQSSGVVGSEEDSKEDGEPEKIDSETKGDDGKAIMDPAHELESGEGEEGSEVTREPKEPEEEEHKSDLSKFKNPIFSLIGGIVGEISKIKKGEIMAMFRLRRNIVALGIVVLVILGGSAYFTLQGGANRAQGSEIASYLNSANSKYEEGVALISLNQEKARQLLSEAKDEVNKALEIDGEDKNALELAEKISTKLKETEVKASVDLSSITSFDEELNSLLKNGDNLVGVSTEKIYEVTVEGEEVDTYDSGGNIQDASIYDNKVFTFDGSQISRVDLADGSSEDLIKGQSAQDISVFLGNIYLLGSDQIYKYVPTEDGYTQSEDYLNNSESIDGAGRLAIDGSIWVTSGNNLNEYLRGDKEDFKLSGLSNGLGKLGEVFADSDSSNVYVIDKDNSALLVFDKNGLYKQAYQSADFARVNGLVVDEEGGKFYVAVGSEILSGDL